MNRKERAEIAEDTLKIIEQGYYINSRAEKIDISKEIKFAVENSQLYTPAELAKIRQKIEEADSLTNKTEIEVNNETTLQAAERLKTKAEFKKIAVLNFASAKNPGGGFLNGSGAQEESLARSSALYPTIKQMQEMYQSNRKYDSSLYQDYMIYSPAVPVFKKDRGELIDQPYLVDFITAPAVNAGAVRANETRDRIDQIDAVMKKRIAKIIALAAEKKVEALVLGAFGCGVFRNDPKMVAQYFNQYLNQEKYYKKYFKKVVFAVLDRSREKKTFENFRNELI
ncbi:MAG: TIGR02452 family protein [Halanaerobium sp.]